MANAARGDCHRRTRRLKGLYTKMIYIDFHTHQVPVSQDVVAVVAGRDTWGVHPWDSLPQPLQGRGERLSFPSEKDLVEGGFLAIGECGLDALRGPSLERQEEVFVQHIALSEKTGKPLIIHCVKALDRLLRLRKALRPSMPWMLHGFRGKPQQLRSLLDAGLFVSFGYSHNAESIRLCPAERLMLETDDQTEHTIAEIYNNVAEKRGLDVAALCKVMAENYRAFFQKVPLLA